MTINEWFGPLLVFYVAASAAWQVVSALRHDREHRELCDLVESTTKSLTTHLAHLTGMLEAAQRLRAIRAKREERPESLTESKPGPRLLPFPGESAGESAGENDGDSWVEERP